MNRYYGNKNYISIKAPSDYPGKRYNNLYCYEHQYVTWKKYKRLPNKNEEIHLWLTEAIVFFQKLDKKSDSNENRPKNST